jgi:alkylation response protein AidB-like acyl-CoA dehydrogenase
MDFSLTSDQLLIRDTVRQFMEAEVRGVIREYEREEKFPAAELRRWKKSRGSMRRSPSRSA